MILRDGLITDYKETHRLYETLHRFVEQLLPLAHGLPSFSILCAFLKFDKDILPSLRVLLLE